MRLANILGTAALLCCLSVSAFAEVQQQEIQERGQAGEFKAKVPRIMLKSSEARAAANVNVQELVNKFRYLADEVGNTNVEYAVTADNDSYVSIIMNSWAMMPESSYMHKEVHALVVDVQTGEKLPLYDFVRIPSPKYLREQVKNGNVKIMFMDGKTELEGFPGDGISQVPREFVVNEYGDVYLVAEEIAIYAVGTPLLFLPRSSVSDIYVNKS